jgi:hypothetical protein
VGSGEKTSLLGCAEEIEWTIQELSPPIPEKRETGYEEAEKRSHL